jgi:hypothetical protein
LAPANQPLRERVTTSTFVGSRRCEQALNGIPEKSPSIRE